MTDELYSKKNNRKIWWSMWIWAVTCLVLLAGISAGVYFLYCSVGNEDAGCSAANCLDTVQEIMSLLDITTHPCDDFYQFTCGNFMSKDNENNSPYFVQHTRNVNKLNAIITESVTGDEREAILLQKTFYQACMNVEAIDGDDNRTFMKLLEVLGGWPVIKGQEWVEDDFHLGEIITHCKNLGFPFQWYFQFLSNEGFYEIRIPKLTSRYNDFLRNYMDVDLMVETAVLLGASRTIATSEMQKVLMFEEELEIVMLRNAENALEPMDLPTLDKVFPRMSWQHLINNIMDESNYTDSENNVTCADETYLRELNLLLAGTSNKTQANYIIWKIVQEFGSFLSTSIHEKFVRYRNYRKSYGEHYESTRFDYCIEAARNRFPGVAETEFIFKYTDVEKYSNILNMIRNIKEQFIERLSNARWIDADTKEAVVNKVNNIEGMIGHQDMDFSIDFSEGLLRDLLDTYDLQFTSDNIIDMVREKNINDFKKLSISANLLSEDDTLRRAFEPYVEFVDNTLFLSAGIVQDIFYSTNRPNFFNYGALGTIIGREIAHDLSKYTYGLNEERTIIIALYKETLHRIINNIILLNSTILRYTEPFNITNSTDYEIEEEPMNLEEKVRDEINENEISMENLIDFIGIDMAYAAYVKWVEENYEEEKLTLLPYTPLQMFWIQFGTINCYREINNIKSPNLKNMQVTMRDMVINSVRSSEYFAEDFECPEGTQMHPFNIL